MHIAGFEIHGYKITGQGLNSGSVREAILKIMTQAA